MDINFDPFFIQYEEIRAEADQLFSLISRRCPDEVKCQAGCTDCCYALFDLTLVEAVFINRKFYLELPDDVKSGVLEEAERADRQIFKLKRKAYRARKKGVPPEEILDEIGRQRVKCPFLTSESKCVLYDHRPVICRVYGVPMVIGEEVRSCRLSGFTGGGKYPSVFIDRVQQKLLALAKDFVSSIPTRYTKLDEVLVPLSMALLTDYDDNYLGLVNSEQAAGSPGSAQWVIGGEED